MGSHAYIQAEDLGLSILGTTQFSYTVNGVHEQDYDTAIYRAALCRSAAVEEALRGYEVVVRTRQKKLNDLGEALAGLNKSISATCKQKDMKTDTEISIDSAYVRLLTRYGFEASKKMTYEKVMPLLQNVQYALDREGNDLQQDMTQMQSYVQKRDDAFQMASKMLQRVAKTRSRGIGYIGS